MGQAGAGNTGDLKQLLMSHYSKSLCNWLYFALGMQPALENKSNSRVFLHQPAKGEIVDDEIVAKHSVSLPDPCTIQAFAWMFLARGKQAAPVPWATMLPPPR